MQNNNSGNPSVQTLSTEENEFLDSLGAPRLKNCADDVILAALKLGMILMGIKKDNAPLDVGMALLIKTCKVDHGMLTIKELRLAFEMAASLKLEFNPHTYQNFSVLYLNELLAAYKRWSTQAYDFLRPGGERQEEKEKQDYSPYLFEHRSINQLRREIQIGYEHFLSGILSTFEYIPYDWYKVLVDDGFIEYDENLKVANKRFKETTNEDDRKLKTMQLLMWDLFTMAKEQSRINIYQNEL